MTWQKNKKYFTKCNSIDRNKEGSSPDYITVSQPLSTLNPDKVTQIYIIYFAKTSDCMFCLLQICPANEIKDHFLLYINFHLRNYFRKHLKFKIPWLTNHNQGLQMMTSTCLQTCNKGSNDRHKNSNNVSECQANWLMLQWQEMTMKSIKCHTEWLDITAIVIKQDLPPYWLSQQ